MSVGRSNACWGRRLLCSALATAAVALLAACDPADVPEQSDAAVVVIAVRNDGRGAVEIAAGGHLDADRLRTLGSELATGGFPGHPPTVVIDSNGGGYPKLRLESSDVFAPGEAPRVTVDLTNVCSGLIAAGYTNITVDLSPPSVATRWQPAGTSPSVAGWHPTDCVPGPIGTLELQPSLWRWWAGISLVTIVGLAAATLAVSRRRSRAGRQLVRGTYAIGALASVGAVFVGVGAMADSPEVRGWFSTDRATAVDMSATIVWLAAVGVIVVLGRRSRATHRPGGSRRDRRALIQTGAETGTPPSSLDSRVPEHSTPHSSNVPRKAE